jgi:predicted hotdog family 3-hydroxylacyl-ACP dehydratase
MRDCHYPIAALLPHKPPMILLDRVIGYDDSSLVAEVTISENSLLLAPEGVPGYVGIEYMAQTCAAYAGVCALDSHKPVKIGFLLGTRDYRLITPWFRIGDRLHISVSLILGDEQMASFDCQIQIDSNLVATAHLMVYQMDENQFDLGDGA